MVPLWNGNQPPPPWFRFGQDGSWIALFTADVAAEAVVGQRDTRKALTYC